MFCAAADGTEAKVGCRTGEARHEQRFRFFRREAVQLRAVAAARFSLKERERLIVSGALPVDSLTSLPANFVIRRSAPRIGLAELVNIVII